MFKMTQWIALAIAIFISQVTTSRAEVYVFGDSLSETGNFFLATGGSLPPAPLYFAGRLTNGNAWVEHFATAIGEPVPLPSLMGGTNFAFNGARVTGISPYGTPSLTDQVSSYLFASGGTVDPSDTFVIWAGANDIFFGASFGEVGAIENAIAGINWSVESLYAAGAQNIIVLDLPQLGQTPFFNTNAEISLQLDLASASFNSELARLLARLEREMPDARITRPKISRLFRSIVRTPRLYGLQNVRDSATLFDPATGLGFAPAPGANADKYLFWDSVHPTSKGHRIVAFHVLIEYLSNCLR